MPNYILTIQAVLFIAAMVLIFTPEKREDKHEDKGNEEVTVAGSATVALKRLKDMKKVDSKEAKAYNRAKEITNEKLKSVLEAYESWMYSEDHPTYKFIATM